MKDFGKAAIPALLLLFALASAFADKSKFYHNGKVIDTMYVDSAEGLRVRDKPSLKSSRLCGLAHRFPVKVVAVGREDSIDGITAPWVEIVLPQAEWKGTEPEYGWIFGGYLSSDCPGSNYDVSTLSGIKNTFIYNLWRIQVYYDEIALLRFYADGSAKIFKYGGEICSFKYKVLDKQTMQINIPSRVVISEWPRLKDEEGAIVKDAFLDERSVHAGTFKFSFGKDEDNQIVFNIEKSPLHGFCADYEFAFYQEFGADYHDYWNPIMAEHQKKADAMK